MNLPQYYNHLVDLLFPRSCLGCGQAKTYLCVTCANGIKRLPPEDWADKLNLHPALDALTIAADYADPLLQRAIHELKYNYVTDLANALGEIMAAAGTDVAGNVSSTDVACNVSTIAPIPLHRRRLLERGFNQAELLANAVAARTGWPVIPNLLLRLRYTDQQAKLSRAERLENTKEAFQVNPKIQPLPECVVLIDDVVTTGSTLIAAATVLKKAGVKTVHGLALAHEDKK